jgi:aspartyl-tRNA(Asn)/glutamyl-tRNA(Gln) amidotransferase subunit A
MTPLRDLTIRTFHEGLLARKFSALEMAQAFFSYIKDTDPKIHAYLSLNEQEALQQAETADVKLAKGEELGPLAGVPIALKDNMLMQGGPATAGSRILEHYTSAYDATVVAKLKAEGAVILGKTNLDEFAMGSSTENSAFGPTKNPHDHSRVAGGSSGGSAAAVASHMAVAALGSDTGGSIRQPAALCGVVGMKPTYSSVSRFGLIALASSLDQIGPFTRTTEDAALLFNAIRGTDPMDATGDRNASYDPDLINPDLRAMRGLRVGLPKEYFVGDGLSPEVAAGVDSVIKTLQDAGVTTKKISLPHTKYALSCYYIILPAEASSNLARLDGIRYARIPGVQDGNATLADIYGKQRGVGFGAEPTRRIILGTFVLSSGHYDAYYDKAQRVRALVKNDFDEAWKDVDVILTPVTPTPAFKLGEKADDPLAMYLSDIFTIPVNLAGLPGVSIPVKNVSGLPIGFQLIGKPFREADILGLGRLYESLNT